MKLKFKLAVVGVLDVVVVSVVDWFDGVSFVVALPGLGVVLEETSLKYSTLV